ncbi:transcriptional regulator [Streptomyces sp. NPDC050738]|uniref:transcriptional regulator n=1 Tax=Streptomyces sp. NPDC050738 TaxID=3154744 RepID=UPI00342E84DC
MRELKELVYQAYLAAGAPSLDMMAADVAADDTLTAAPSRDTLHRIISSPDIPAQQADLLALVTVLTRRAAWPEGEATRQAGNLWVAARLERPVGKLIGELNDPYDLEVHRAIEVEATARLTGPELLPAYVRREHDEALRQAAQEAADGESRLVMLVGSSSTGKTRACWETLQELPPHWRLWHPIDPERPKAALASLGHVGPHTVVWINESHHYLLPPDREVGEQVAAGLRELLRDPARQPVLVLGTIWPEYQDQLMAEPVPGKPDPYAQARSLLSGRSKTVPAAFDPAALRDLADKARTDQRLAYAAERAEGGHITQYLAGAPELLARYEAAPPGARALIIAAMDARRAGHGLDLPHAFLASAAEGYLSDQEWDLLTDDWLEAAFAYVAKPVRGARGILSRRRPRQGEPGGGPMYRLADYLEQHGRNTRRTQPVPASLWEAALHHSAGVSTLGLADFAGACGLFRIAFLLNHRARQRGDGKANARAAEGLRVSGREEEALEWYLRGANAGDAFSSRRAAQILGRNGKVGQAIAHYRKAFSAGDTYSADLASDLLRTHGLADQTRHWTEMTPFMVGLDGSLIVLDRVSVGGGTRLKAGLDGELRAPSGEAADRLRDQGRSDEALKAYEQAAADGDLSALRRAAGMLRLNGKIDESVAWYQRAFRGGDVNALWRAGSALADEGRDEEALTWYLRAAEAGQPSALRRAGYLLQRRGRLGEALEWTRRAGQSGDGHALSRAAELLSRQGRADEAMALKKYGWNADGSISEPWEPTLLAAETAFD